MLNLLYCVLFVMLCFVKDKKKRNNLLPVALLAAAPCSTGYELDSKYLNLNI